MTRGKLIVIVAPSGAGKSTLISRLKNDYPDLLESTSYTTRPRREGEIHGQHYFFVSKEEFIERRDQGEFFEWAVVHSNLYGTSKIFVEEKLSEGKSLLFDLDVQGADSLKKHFNDEANIIFIAPPSIEELGNRLRKRGTETEEVILERLKNAERELKRKEDYDHWVLNDDLEKAYVKLRDIFKSVLEG